MDDLLNGLNPAQKASVTSQADVLQVLAPPGSGKTKTLTARVAYLISVCNYKPWNILVCTFTVKAAREMKERIRQLVGDGLEKKLILGTFHSVARRFLSSYGHHIGLERDFGIADTSDTKAIAKRIIKDHGLSLDPGRALSRISSNKAKGITADQFAATAKKTRTDEQEFVVVYSQYQAALELSNLLDYDDLLLKCAFLLRSHPQCASNIEAVLIDEFQDTNEVQYDLMNLFAQAKRTITIVGDPDQSIYGWRNAEIENLNRMKRQYPDTVVIFLEENYRSSGAILNSAQIVIEQDESRPEKRLQATHTHGERPVLRRLPTAEAEARWLVAEVMRTEALSGGLLQHNDFVVLLRSAQLSRHIESALGNAGIPYRMVGGTKFYDRVEIKILLDYLRVINQPEHNDALLRVINVPPRNVGEVTVKKLLDEANEKRLPVWKLLLASVQGRLTTRTKLSAQSERGLAEFINVILSGQKKFANAEGHIASPGDLLDFVLKKLDYQKFLERKYSEDHAARWANVEELQAQTAELSSAITRGDAELAGESLPPVEGLEQAERTDGDDTLSVFLANIALSGATEQKDAQGAAQEQCLTISTIHAAKGLEWPVVFIPACYEGSIPHSRAENNDEERRLLYVGMTRAQAMLYLSCPTKNSQSQETTLSSFLSPSGVEATFATKGPELEYYNVSRLAVTLGRQCPDFEVVDEMRMKSDQYDDAYWPEDGSFPIEESARWDHGKRFYAPTSFQRGGSGSLLKQQASYGSREGFMSAAKVTMNQPEGFSVASTTLVHGKFASAASRLHELEEAQEKAALSKLDRRSQKAATTKQSAVPSSKHGGNIATMFGRPASSSAVRHQPPPMMDDMSSIAPIAGRTIVPSAQAMHRPRTAPLLTRPTSAQNGAQHIFIPSSPLKSSDNEAERENKRPKTHAEEDEGFTVRPATTMHTTTVMAAKIPLAGAGGGRRTLGLGRGFKPWSARGR